MSGDSTEDHPWRSPFRVDPEVLMNHSAAMLDAPGN
jgi:hypothetical protein